MSRSAAGLAVVACLAVLTAGCGTSSGAPQGPFPAGKGAIARFLPPLHGELTDYMPG